MEDLHLSGELGYIEKSKPNKIKKLSAYFFGVVVFLCLGYFFLLSAPSDFPSGSIIKVEKGSSVRSVSYLLKTNHIIRSRTAFEFFVILLGKNERVISTDYYFENSIPVYAVANRISKGENHIAPISVTIPEGFDNIQTGDAFVSKLPNFNEELFLSKAKALQGYLFPDTYFLSITDNEQDVLEIMSQNFEKKIAPILPSIHVHTEAEIINMASIIEHEAKGDADRQVISGILWRRIALGMPLQVDAAPETYKMKGLPKAPICNPGLEAINAAISAKTSPYLYYLHDKNGVAHYAKTLAEHDANINKYLK